MSGSACADYATFRSNDFASDACPDRRPATIKVLKIVLTEHGVPPGSQLTASGRGEAFQAIMAVLRKK